MRESGVQISASAIHLCVVFSHPRWLCTDFCSIIREYHFFFAASIQLYLCYTFKVQTCLPHVSLFLSPPLYYFGLLWGATVNRSRCFKQVVCVAHAHLQAGLQGEHTRASIYEVHWASLAFGSLTSPKYNNVHLLSIRVCQRDCTEDCNHSVFFAASKVTCTCKPFSV